MRHCKCRLSDLQIDINEIYCNMGYKSVPEGEIRMLTDKYLSEAASVCNPQYLYDTFKGHTVDRTTTLIGEKVFKVGPVINSYLSGATSFCVFVTTAGHEFDNYKKNIKESGDLVKEFILDAIGSVIAEACVTKIAQELSLSGVEQTYPYSPGYCGWRVDEQQKLFSLLPESPCGIALTESSLMLPIKSVSGIIASGERVERKAYGCAICKNINCYKRKTVSS